MDDGTLVLEDEDGLGFDVAPKLGFGAVGGGEMILLTAFDRATVGLVPNDIEVAMLGTTEPRTLVEAAKGGFDATGCVGCSNDGLTVSVEESVSERRRSMRGGMGGLLTVADGDVLPDGLRANSLCCGTLDTGLNDTVGRRSPLLPLPLLLVGKVGSTI